MRSLGFWKYLVIVALLLLPRLGAAQVVNTEPLINVAAIPSQGLVVIEFSRWVAAGDLVTIEQTFDLDQIPVTWMGLIANRTITDPTNSYQTSLVSGIALPSPSWPHLGYRLTRFPHGSPTSDATVIVRVDNSVGEPLSVLTVGSPGAGVASSLTGIPSELFYVAGQPGPIIGQHSFLQGSQVVLSTVLTGTVSCGPAFVWTGCDATSQFYPRCRVSLNSDATVSLSLVPPVLNSAVPGAGMHVLRLGLTNPGYNVGVPVFPFCAFKIEASNSLDGPSWTNVGQVSVLNNSSNATANIQLPAQYITPFYVRLVLTDPSGNTVASNALPSQVAPLPPTNLVTKP